MFEIKELHHNFPRPHVTLDIEGLEALPYALKRLAELGHDMERSLAVLQQAVDDQRKQKVLQAAINAITADQVKK